MVSDDMTGFLFRIEMQHPDKDGALMRLPLFFGLQIPVAEFAATEGLCYRQ
jgi:hypothetical protein